MIVIAVRGFFCWVCHDGGGHVNALGIHRGQCRVAAQNELPHTHGIDVRYDGGGAVIPRAPVLENIFCPVGVYRRKLGHRAVGSGVASGRFHISRDINAIYRHGIACAAG
ncbi:hypothetical protein SDC9_79453 [bioreactor metagenome]|uniref:Uncharacterized protein n=1 Tax=bioreactor metagenome TaxID=1076179 RepID=A0A644YWY9_9ZZZZ